MLIIGHNISVSSHFYGFADYVFLPCSFYLSRQTHVITLLDNSDPLEDVRALRDFSFDLIACFLRRIPYETANCRIDIL